jgi:hypothetical protein
LSNKKINIYLKVVLQNCLSEVGNIKGGVPQGSVLGPLLFILYINDITEDIQSLSRLFADDSTPPLMFPTSERQFCRTTF